MSRYTGPRLRISRRLETNLSGLTRKTIDRRPYPPGMHGPTPRRRRLSEYAVRSREKQKVRFYYGLSESQLRRFLERAARKPGPTGENLLATLEARLDNAVFRLGLAPTIPAARQLVGHGHVLVNGKRVSVPGYELRAGDRIELGERARANPVLRAPAEHGPELRIPSFLERTEDGFGGRVVARPSRGDVALEVDEALVVEFYAR